MIQEIINKIEQEIELRKNMPNNHEQLDICYGLNRAKDIVSTMTDAKWIPVEERLPEGGEVVQVTVRRGWVDVGYYDESREEWWTLDDNGLMDVIAWQPMAELALEACKKQVPQKIKNALYGEKDKQLWAAECPICGILQSPSNMYCDKCGQRLLWDAPTGEVIS